MASTNDLEPEHEGKVTLISLSAILAAKAKAYIALPFSVVRLIVMYGDKQSLFLNESGILVANFNVATGAASLPSMNK